MALGSNIELLRDDKPDSGYDGTEVIVESDPVDPRGTMLSVDQWIHNGFTFAEGLRWAEAGYTPAQARLLADEGWEPESARRPWVDTDDDIYETVDPGRINWFDLVVLADIDDTDDEPCTFDSPHQHEPVRPPVSRSRLWRRRGPEPVPMFDL